MLSRKDYFCCTSPESEHYFYMKTFAGQPIAKKLSLSWKTLKNKQETFRYGLQNTQQARTKEHNWVNSTSNRKEKAMPKEQLQEQLGFSDFVTTWQSSFLFFYWFKNSGHLI